MRRASPESGGHTPNAAEFRREVRAGRWSGPTSTAATGFLQANVLLLPEPWAADFRRFCILNPRPAPLLAVTAPGDPYPGELARDADLRTDLPAYHVYRDGELVDEPHDLSAWYRDDLVGFIVGCSFTFERALLDAGVPLRHIERGANVAMFETKLPLVSAGPYGGTMVVTMRPIPTTDIPRAAQITADYPIAHGGPIAIGTTSSLGIRSLNTPEHGDPCPIEPGEVPVFWPCGVTAEMIARDSGCPFFITHSPGHMLVTDIRHEHARALRPLGS